MEQQIIVSVPHTGSRFLQARLGINGMIHTKSDWEYILFRTQGRQVVTPLRSPLDNWLSWSRKARELQMQHVAEWYDCWYKLHALSQITTIDFICVDKRTDPRITDWTPVGHNATANNVHALPTLKFIYELPFVKAYYNLQDDLVNTFGRNEIEWIGGLDNAGTFR